MAEKKYSKDMFVFVQENERIKDKKFDTKPVGFFKDCLNRFVKNKSSVVAFFIIVALLLFAIIAPMTTSYGINSISGDEGYYVNLLPRTHIFEAIGWDGAKETEMTQAQYDVYNGQSVEDGGLKSILSDVKISTITETLQDGSTNTYNKYTGRLSSYYKIGYVYKTVTKSEYQKIIEYQNENDVQILFPITATYNYTCSIWDAANLWYKTTGDPYASDPEFLTKFNYDYDSATLDQMDKDYGRVVNATRNMVQDNRGNAYYDENGNYVPNYLYKNTDQYALDGGRKIDSDYNTVEIGGETYYAQYRVSIQGGYKVRILYYEYYIMKYGTEPYFYFGTDQFAHDIYSCLGVGARLSFILSISVSLINLIIGFIYGSIEGYYGGAADLIMERISDILASVPFIVVATLFQLHLADKVGTFVSLLFAFVLTGWIGIASTVRHQFYRFKNQEYILAARTLGAKDSRLIFKHIFPNAMGTIITSCVLIIPGVIFSESILSYLGIVSFKTSTTLTSIGTMLSNGQGSISTYPHIIFFPALFISLLEISFNLFGNGLRDAFNPSLRGSED